MTRRGLIGSTAGVAVLALCASVVAAFTPWPIDAPALRDSVARQIDQATGLDATALGAMTVRLLPRPTVRVEDVTISGMEGAVSLDAAALLARLNWGALLGGTLRLGGATLDHPTAVIDLDRIAAVVDADPARPQTSSPLLSLLHTPGLAIRAGVLRLRSVDPQRDVLVTDITTDFSWPGSDAGLTLSGTGTVRGVSGSFELDVERPAAIEHGGQTIASGTIRSVVLDLQAKGVINGSGDQQAIGTLEASTPELSAFLRTIGIAAPQVGGVQAARLDGAVALSGDTLAFSDIALTLDDMLFDGAMAVHQRGERISVTGTLATDTIDLDRFVEVVPPFVGPDGRWSEALLQTSAIAYDDIDLRVSAQTAKLGGLLIEDGSLSLQSGEGRLEMSVGEARAYDGLLKGRIVATVDGGETDVRAEATLSRLDLGALMAGLPDRYPASGILTGHATLESRGTTPASLVDGLAGQGQLTLHDGEIGGALVSRLVHTAPSATGSSLALDGGSTPFDTATLAFTMQKGVASLNESWIAWPATRAVLTGTASLPSQTLGVRASLGGADGPEQYVLEGPWRALHLNPVRPRS